MLTLQYFLTYGTLFFVVILLMEDCEMANRSDFSVGHSARASGEYAKPEEDAVLRSNPPK